MPSPDPSMSHERNFPAGVDILLWMVVSATFPKPGKTEGCILGTPYHEPEAAPALPRDRVTGARSRSGCQVLVELNASLMVSDHVTSAMPSPDSSMSHERIFPWQASNFSLDGGIRHSSKTRKDRN